MMTLDETLKVDNMDLNDYSVFLQKYDLSYESVDWYYQVGACLGNPLVG